MTNAWAFARAGETSISDKATELANPMPQMAEVGVSISRMPGPPAGPS